MNKLVQQSINYMYIVASFGTVQSYMYNQLLGHILILNHLKIYNCLAASFEMGCLTKQALLKTTLQK